MKIISSAPATAVPRSAKDKPPSWPSPPSVRRSASAEGALAVDPPANASAIAKAPEASASASSSTQDPVPQPSGSAKDALSVDPPANANDAVANAPEVGIEASASSSTQAPAPEPSASANQPSAVAPPPAGNASSMVVVETLLATMRQSTGLLGTALESLTQQTAKMEALVPAVDALEQVHTLKKEFAEVVARQNERMQALESKLDVTLQTMREEYQAKAMTMVQEIVQREVQERVKQQLESLVPKDLEEKSLRHRRQILEVQTSLHNSEARRHNATLRSANALTAPLRPLLRPLPSAAQSPAYLAPMTSLPVPDTSVPPASSIVPNAPLPTPVSVPVPAPANHLSEPQLRMSLEPPTPSAIFPKDLQTLMNLGPEEARRLLIEYGLVSVSAVSESKPPSAVSPASSTASGDTIVATAPSPVYESRERDLSRFMAHIGVPFQMIPAPKPRDDSKTSRSGRPLLTLITALDGYQQW